MPGHKRASLDGCLRGPKSFDFSTALRRGRLWGMAFDDRRNSGTHEPEASVPQQDRSHPMTGARQSSWVRRETGKE